MKRSEINAIIREADDFIRAHGFHLPPFAHWTPDEWKTKGPEVREIVERKLGWDVTDFNLGEYRQTGADVIKERLASLRVPTVIGLPFGHLPHNSTIPHGVRAILDAKHGTLVITEAAVR